MTEEERREMTRSNYAAQMEMLGYDNSGNPLEMVRVTHGRWIINKYGETVCSECDNNALQVLTGCYVNRHFEPHKSKYCPNCGARMDGGPDA